MLAKDLLAAEVEEMALFKFLAGLLLVMDTLWRRNISLVPVVFDEKTAMIQQSNRFGEPCSDLRLGSDVMQVGA